MQLASRTSVAARGTQTSNPRRNWRKTHSTISTIRLRSLFRSSLLHRSLSQKSRPFGRLLLFVHQACVPIASCARSIHREGYRRTGGGCLRAIRRYCGDLEYAFSILPAGLEVPRGLPVRIG